MHRQTEAAIYASSALKKTTDGLFSLSFSLYTLNNSGEICVQKRERERETDRMGFFTSAHQAKKKMRM